MVKKFIVFEAFAGYGGAHFGLKKQKIPHEVVGFSEFDKFADEIYRLNHSNVKAFGDITLINENNLPKFNLFTGGFPCQPFSKNGYWVTHNKRKVDKDPRNLIHQFLEVVAQNNADGFLLENVESILHQTNKHVADKIMLWGMNKGYEMKCFKLNAYNYGVPQKRKRVFYKKVYLQI